VTSVRWGILGTGRIAHQFAQDFPWVKNGVLGAVASRSQPGADTFGARYDIPRRYSSYADMLDDNGIDVIYIATPHNHHFRNTTDAIAAGKSVLCEKPLTVSPDECGELIRQATDARVYVMEAMWTWFLPPILKAREWVATGRIGHIRHIKANFGVRVPYDPSRREYCVDNAGGCMRELGIYPVAITCLFMPQDPDTMQSVVRKAANGVEDDVVSEWRYPAGTATLSTSFRTKLRNWAHIVGDEGHIEIPDFWRARECRLYQRDTLVERFKDRRKSLGLNFEATAVGEDLLAGRQQSDVVPLATSLLFQERMQRVLAGESLSCT